LEPPAESTRFAEVALPHLDAAYNLARWITRDSSDASDVVQEAMLRALRFFGSYRGGSSKSWLLTIVRNTAMDWMRANRRTDIVVSVRDGADESASEIDNVASENDDPETALIRAGDHARLDRLVTTLPTEFRECLVLREMEGLSYKEIAIVTSAPIGTVMSRLARARQLLQRNWTKEDAR
jgi:RNA polymerase sigma-70 factor (ECF subfamily)